MRELEKRSGDDRILEMINVKFQKDQWELKKKKTQENKWCQKSKKDQREENKELQICKEY